MTESLALIALTVLDIAALQILIGALACRLWLLPVADRAYAPVQSWRLTRLTGGCLVVLSLTSIALLLNSAHEMSGVGYRHIGPVLLTVLRATHFGHVWIVRALAIAALWLTYAMRRSARRETVPGLAMLVLVAILAFARSASGHAADMGNFSPHEIGDWVHLMTTSLWAGGVIAASLTVFRVAEASGLRALSDQGARLSVLATAAFGIVLGSGIYDAWCTFDYPNQLWTTVYGQRLLIKLLFVAGMLGCGVANRYLYLPALSRRSRARRFVHVLQAEAVFAFGAITAVAIMINTAPPRDTAAAGTPVAYRLHAAPLAMTPLSLSSL